MLGLTPGLIDVAAVRNAVDDPGFGAILVFEGVARDNFDGRRVTHLAYEAYEELAIPVLQAIADECLEKFGAKCAIVHRTGPVPIEDPTVVIAVGTPHRPACYEASRYALEALKARLPVWKKEVYDDGHDWKRNQVADE
jgi:molybdopterin synthase catalytic subunit